MMVTKNRKRIRTISCVVLAAFLIQGCTSYHKQDVRVGTELEELNQKGETDNSRIYMSDGYRYSAAKLNVQPDSSFWCAGEGVLPVQRPTPDIEKVIFVSRPKGALDAFLYGAIPGFVYMGLFAFGMSAGMGGKDYDEAAGLGIAYAVGGGIVTGLLAVPIGWIVGHRDVYELYDSTPDTEK